jgi:hypothetical protein
MFSLHCGAKKGSGRRNGVCVTFRARLARVEASVLALARRWQLAGALNAA